MIHVHVEVERNINSVVDADKNISVKGCHFMVATFFVVKHVDVNVR